MCCSHDKLISTHTKQQTWGGGGCLPAVVWKFLVFLGVVLSTVWRKCGRRDATERRGRREEGHSMVLGFLKGILSPSRHLQLKQGPCECVGVATWVVCLLLTSICFSWVAKVTRTADYRDGATRLPEVGLSQAAVYDQSPWLFILISGNEANLCNENETGLTQVNKSLGNQSNYPKIDSYLLILCCH